MVFPDKSLCQTRVDRTVKRLRRIRVAPVRFAHRVKLACSIMSAATFGTEQIDFTVNQAEALRSAVVYLLWKGKSWLHCSAATFTLLVPGHQVLASIASTYHTLCVVHRILTRRHDLHQGFVALWHCASFTRGPVNRLWKIFHSIHAQWVEPFCFHTQEGNTINLLNPNQMQFKHQVRAALRDFVFRTNKAFLFRQDMQGGYRVAYEPTVALIRQDLSKKGKNKNNRKTPSLSLLQLATLRNILTGAVRTFDKLHKANCANSPMRPWCNCPKETVFHIFWECPQWQDIRQQFINIYPDIFPDILHKFSPCTLLCGILSQHSFDDRILLNINATKFCVQLQTTMINIVRKRDAAVALLPKDCSQDEPIDSIRADLSLGHTQKDRLFPSFPWNFNPQCTQSFFQGTPPPNWRVAKKGSEWLFGIPLFAPLVWYWRNLQWPIDNDVFQTTESVSWLELAIDFHAVTHCQLSRPNEDDTHKTAQSCARFFAAASRRMAIICKSQLAPTRHFDHVPSLTALGLGRAAGLQCRPKIMSPDFVNNSLFKIALLQMQNSQDVKLSKLVLALDTPPPPKWTQQTRKIRLTGKQSVPFVSVPKPRRCQVSHKAVAAVVVWTAEELAEIQVEDHWRDRQRIEKRILHNRDAVKQKQTPNSSVWSEGKSNM